MIYWFTGTFTSSFWLYYMRRSGDNVQHKLLEETKIEQPFWFGCGPYEIHWVGTLQNILVVEHSLTIFTLKQPVRKAFELQVTKIRGWKVLDKGGHFLAWEAPEVLAKDVDAAFQSEEVQKLFGRSSSSKM